MVASSFGDVLPGNVIKSEPPQTTSRQEFMPATLRYIIANTSSDPTQEGVTVVNSNQNKGKNDEAPSPKELRNNQNYGTAQDPNTPKKKNYVQPI